MRCCVLRHRSSISVSMLLNILTIISKKWENIIIDRTLERLPAIGRLFITFCYRENINCASRETGLSRNRPWIANGLPLSKILRRLVPPPRPLPCVPFSKEKIFERKNTSDGLSILVKRCENNPIPLTVNCKIMASCKIMAKSWREDRLLKRMAEDIGYRESWAIPPSPPDFIPLSLYDSLSLDLL